MSFPAPAKFNLVVAATNSEGDFDFLDVPGPATLDIPGAVSAGAYWKVSDGHSLSNFGEVPSNAGVAGFNGSALSVVCFPARSAGKLNADDAGADFRDSDGDHNDDPSMHATDTIDYEIILSGKVDMELPGGKVRTLQPGDLLVMGGVPHAWKNHYDEDCVYVAVTIGFNK